MKFLALFVCLSCSGADFENKLANAIYIAEGGTNTHFPYGIHSKRPLDASEARQWCLNTIRHQKRLYGLNRPYGDDFIVFLGKTYAQDPLWADKVKRIMRRQGYLVSPSSGF